MQIAVTNQKTKSIRPACLLAGSGSQGTNSAAAVAAAPNTIPIATSWTIDPLRTGAETTRLRSSFAEGSAGARNACNEWDSAETEPGTTGALTLRRFDGTRSQHSAYRRRCDSRFRSEHNSHRRRHQHDRLDPAHRRHRWRGALDDLLVHVGRSRLLVTPPRPRLRRRGPPALLGATVRPERRQRRSGSFRQAHPSKRQPLRGARARASRRAARTSRVPARGAVSPR